MNLSTLQTVTDLSTRKRDDAALAMARAQQDLLGAQQQLEQLSAYEQEGQQKWMERCSVGVSATLLQHHRQFMLKIEQALAYQHNVVTQRQAHLERTRLQLQATERQVATFDKVKQRTLQTMAQTQQRREQKQTDEMAMSMLAHQRRNNARESSP